MLLPRSEQFLHQIAGLKPTKWGIKWWVLADSSYGYTYDFDVYARRKAGQVLSEHGLAYDVEMRLVQSLLDHGYHLYFHNFCTSLQLIKDLFQNCIPETGTATENQKSFPLSKKGGKAWARQKE